MSILSRSQKVHVSRFFYLQHGVEFACYELLSCHASCGAMQAKRPEMAQDADVIQALAFPNLVVLLACIHLLSISVFAVRVWFNFSLPGNIETRHQIYHGLENAAARILLPYKMDAYGALYEDLSSVNNLEETDSVPECVGVGSESDSGESDSLAPGGVLSELPTWALPDDNTGMNDMLYELVRRFPECTVSRWLCWLWLLHVSVEVRRLYIPHVPKKTKSGITRASYRTRTGTFTVVTCPVTYKSCSPGLASSSKDMSGSSGSSCVQILVLR